jgi:hypothetical protein
VVFIVKATLLRSKKSNYCPLQDLARNHLSLYTATTIVNISRYDNRITITRRPGVRDSTLTWWQILTPTAQQSQCQPHRHMMDINLKNLLNSSYKILIFSLIPHDCKLHSCQWHLNVQPEKSSIVCK